MPARSPAAPYLPNALRRPGLPGAQAAGLPPKADASPFQNVAPWLPSESEAAELTEKPQWGFIALGVGLAIALGLGLIWAVRGRGAAR